MFAKRIVFKTKQAPIGQDHYWGDQTVALTVMPLAKIFITK